MSFDFAVFWSAFLSVTFFKAAAISVLLALLAQILSILISVPMALALGSGSRVVRGLVQTYVAVFRAIPALLQLLFFWNALPQFHPVFRESWYTPFLAALVAFSINEAAYQIEINRAALKAIDPGQIAAARAFGFSRLQTFFRVTLPQAARVALPPTVNEYITLLKATSLASVIALQELMTVTNQAVATSFMFKEYYLAAGFYYLVIVGLLTIYQQRLERRFEWSARRTPRRSLLRLLGRAAQGGRG
jgi:His/Glu/Gln/Arg/opine family amino acid ABC transporter permease subunit